MVEHAASSSRSLPGAVIGALMRGVIDVAGGGQARPDVHHRRSRPGGGASRRRRPPAATLPRSIAMPDQFD